MSIPMKKEAWWPLMINVPVDEERFEWNWDRWEDKLDSFLTFDKTKRLKAKVEKAAKEFMASDPNVQKYVGNIMQVYVENYYSKVWPAMQKANALYHEDKPYEFLVEMSTLFNTAVAPLVASASKNLDGVIDWVEKVYGDAHAYFAKQYGLQVEQEAQQQSQTATASVGYLFAAVDPGFDFHRRVALIPIPFPFIVSIDTDDPDQVRRWKPFMPSVQPLMTHLVDGLKKRRKKSKERKHERIREENLFYLANKWARKEVDEHKTVQGLANTVKKKFLNPLWEGKKYMKKARWYADKGDMYNAVRSVALAYQQTFIPVSNDIEQLVSAMNQTSTIYEAHIKHFSDYVANGGKLPKLASVRVGGAVYRQIVAPISVSE